MGMIFFLNFYKELNSNWIVQIGQFELVPNNNNLIYFNTNSIHAELSGIDFKFWFKSSINPHPERYKRPWHTANGDT